MEGDAFRGVFDEDDLLEGFLVVGFGFPLIVLGDGGGFREVEVDVEFAGEGEDGFAVFGGRGGEDGEGGGDEEEQCVALHDAGRLREDRGSC